MTSPVFEFVLMAFLVAFGCWFPWWINRGSKAWRTAQAARLAALEAVK